jgi:hypothetical protein
MAGWPWRAAITTIFFATRFSLLAVQGQDCFFPDGTLTGADGGLPQAPCSTSSENSTCCDLGWLCRSDNLCFNEGQQILQRSSCTDESWSSEKCPLFCVNAPSNPNGNVAVLQCDDGSYCCDGDRSFNCCTSTSGAFFKLAKATVYASISTLPTPTALAVTSMNGDIGSGRQRMIYDIRQTTY